MLPAIIMWNPAGLLEDIPASLYITTQTSPLVLIASIQKVSRECSTFQNVHKKEDFAKSEPELLPLLLDLSLFLVIQERYGHSCNFLG